MYKKNTGFTLIELMITVAILAIIAAIAYPSYQQYVLETRRAVAQAGLLELSSLMERHYSDNNENPFSYEITAEKFNQLKNAVSRRTDYYDFAISDATSTGYTLTAEPQEGSPQENDPCGTMTINQTGRHTPEDPDCW